WSVSIRFAELEPPPPPEPPMPPPPPLYGVTITLSPTEERLELISCVILFPRIPMAPIATTPMMIPSIARVERSMWIRMFRLEISQNIVLMLQFSRQRSVSYGLYNWQRWSHGSRR